MEFSIEKTSKDLAKGAGIIFCGIFLMYLIKFFYRIIVSRYLGPEGYGILSLGDMVMNIGSMIALIGLDVGLMKHLAFYIEKNDVARLKGTFWLTMIIPGILGIIITILIIIFSKELAIGVFNNSKFTPVLIVFSMAIPFSIFSRIISQTMLSFKKQVFDIYIKVFARDLLSFILATIIVINGGNILGISLTYLFALIIATIMGFYLLEKKIFSFLNKKIASLYEVKKKVNFALPLFFSALFISFMTWTDTFFLGILKTTTEVGIYNIALPLATSLGIFISAFTPIFYPIIGELLAKGQENKIHYIYETNMRWMFILAFPVLMLILLFPNTIIKTLFGSEYISGSLTLMILSLTYFTNILFGLTFETLVSFNKTKLIFWLNSGAVIVNIILNLLLIPHYGIEGAALATGLTIVLRESIAFSIVKKIALINIQLRSYIKSILATFLAFFFSFNILTFILKGNLDMWYIKLIFLILFGIIYILFLLLFRTLNQQDKNILIAIRKRLKIKSKYLQRFK